MAELTTTFASAPAETDHTVQIERVMSVDALRGFDMFRILGMDSLVLGLNRMSQSAPTKFLATRLEHAEGEGFHFYDLIFPPRLLGVQATS